jgi:hypothetical protein
MARDACGRFCVDPLEFEVAVTWSMYGTYRVKASSLAEAEEKVLDCEPPYDALPKGEYIDESMKIDK